MRGLDGGALPALWLAGLCGCFSGGAELEGLAVKNPNDTGPVVVWDLDARPLPDVPFPNDIGTRPEPDSPTGRRVNVSTEATTEHERRLRRLMNGLDGFGTFAPLWVRFDGRIDVADLYRRQVDEDLGNDGVYLVNVDRASRAFGNVVPLDVGSGPPDFGAARFPVGLDESDGYFMGDPRAQSSNLLFETEDEDVDGDGEMDPGEDTDEDGVLDEPNLWGTVLGDDRLLDPFRHLMTFYELESNTLMLRPAVPLEQLSKYAVLVTRNVVGHESGSPVRSPFEWVHHLQHTEALRPLLERGVLGDLGISVEDLAFAWTFTTQSITKDFEVIRAGLYGHGPLARLADDFSDQLQAVPEVDDPAFTDNVHVITTPRLVNALNNDSILQVIQIPPSAGDALAAAYEEYVDYFVFAEVDSPLFLDPARGYFDVDWRSGRAEYIHDTVYLNCAVPKARYGFQPPFPVVMYNHGSGSTRLEVLGFGASLARFGLATCAVDAYGHGLLDNAIIRGLADIILGSDDLSKLAEMVFAGRARDLNGDGFKDSGGDFWTIDLFRTRDATRQTVVDYFQVLRVMRQFGKTTMPVDIDGDGHHELAGDFNGDGVPDLGGSQPFYMMGQSLGGIMTAVLGAVEPHLEAIAPVVAGAGFTDVAVRSVQPGLREGVFLPVLGSLVVGERLGESRWRLALNARDVIYERDEVFALVPDVSSGQDAELRAGDRVRVLNLDNGEMDEILVRSQDFFRLTVATDNGDRLQVELYRKGEHEPFRVINTFERLSSAIVTGGYQGKRIELGDSLRALQDGFGMRRGTPELRRLTQIAQHIVDPADPANYARYFHEPMDLSYSDNGPKNVLVVSSTGDMRVPVNTGITLGRLAGILNPDEIDSRYGVSSEQVLRDTWVIEGLEKVRRFADDPCRYDSRAVLFDIDDASNGTDTTQGPTLPDVDVHPHCDGSPEEPDFCGPCESRPPLRATMQNPWGVSGARFMYLDSQGAHSFRLPKPTLDFDYPQYQINQIGWFFATGGSEISDDPCLETPQGCSFFAR